MAFRWRANDGPILLARPMRLAGVRQWSDFVCLFGLKLLGTQKNRLTAVNNFPC